MNKTKKIAIAVASLVMAGTMALGIVGCGGGGGGGSSATQPKLDENGKLTYTDGTALSLNIGNAKDGKDFGMGIAFQTTELSGATTLPDGKPYSLKSLKPAWQGVSDVLKLTLTDSFQNLGSEAQIKTPVDNNETGKYDLISGSLSKIVEYSDNFVDLNQYLEYMPNYKAFLEANPVTKYSLTGNTSGGMFAAPYFDGNDDIEKYVLADYVLISKILGDSYTNTNTYAWQLGKKKEKWNAASEAGKALATDATKSYAKPFMPTTGTISVKTVPLAGSGELVDAVVSYTDAHTAATTSGQALYEAINTAAGKPYTGESGNIVDLQNFAIDESDGAVTGAQLAKILTEYIKVAYKVGGTAYTKPEDVFLSVSAAWDVDLLVALSRVAICDGEDGLQYGISGRETTTQRRVDLLAFAGELYGIRGLESRYEYAYFDKDGKLHDAREEGATYDLLDRMSDLTKEGIVYIGGLDGTKKTSIKKGVTSGERTMMLHDYAQTQTTDGLAKDGGKTDKSEFNFAPILTPVSKWDPDGDGTTENMRFTESWRSVKNTGFAVPKAAVEGNPEKLSAILTLIDYMFSNDGQILLTYGTKATGEDENATGGWWYAKNSTKTLADVAEKVADGYGHVPAQYKVKDTEKANVFVYNGQVLEGMKYSDRNVPTVTKLNNDFYLGKEITVGSSTKIKQGAGNIKVSAVGSYTDYARYIIGSTLPVGNKDQGYEYQATAQCAIDGAKMVSNALIAGAIKHVKLTLDDGESPWYLIVPTALPLIKSDRDTLTGSTQTAFGNYFYNSSSTGQIFNVALDMLYYGLGSSVSPCGKNNLSIGKDYTAYTTGAALATKLGTEGLTERLQVMRRGWKNLNDLYELGYNL